MYLRACILALGWILLISAGCAPARSGRSDSPSPGRETGESPAASARESGALIASPSSDPADWPVAPPKERRLGGYVVTLADVAPNRFVMTVAGHQLAIPFRRSHPLDQSHEQITRLIVAIPAVEKAIMGQFDRWVMRGEQEGVDDHTAVIGLQFLNPADYVNAGLTDDNRLLYWDTQDWTQGDLSASFPAAPRPARISSFSVADSAIARALDAFPNVRTVIVTGNSAGGNWTQRYAAGNPWPEWRPDIRWGFVTSNMGMFFYLTHERAINEARDEFVMMDVCPPGLRYPFGTDSLNAYMSQTPVNRMRTHYGERNIVHAIGTADTVVSWYYEYCNYRMQGDQRYERHQIWRRYLAHLYGEDIFARQQVYEMPGLTHDVEPWGREILRRLLYHWEPGAEPLPESAE